MGVTKIEWADFSFNPWHGCTKVSEGCKNCYAEGITTRFGGNHFGPGSTRKPMTNTYWEKPYKWNEKAKKDGKPALVFCASMADVFEGHPETITPLVRLFSVIFYTPHLRWLLLTKRPGNIKPLIAKVIDATAEENVRDWLCEWLKGIAPENIWIGTSIENQHRESRIDELCKVPARVRFLSIEPLLGSFEIGLAGTAPANWSNGYKMVWQMINWVIVGGESGYLARPMHPDWVRQIRDECQSFGIPFLFKQWGEWFPFYDRDKDDPDWRSIPKETPSVKRINLSGGDGFHGERVVYFRRAGKKESGRLLDGREHNEFPTF